MIAEKRMIGFINCNKPSGLTSSDVVSRIRRWSGGEKTGHTGTLDPGAAGVLPIALGKANRLFDFLTRKKKKYRAVFSFGVTTDTLDAYGAILGRGRVPDEGEIRAVLPELTGRISQIPPAYSAINVNGVRAYKLARNDIPVEISPREVEVFSFELKRRVDESSFEFDITCGGGTYIRSLVRDLAARLGTVGYMSTLIRLYSGVFAIEDALSLEEIRDDFGAAVLPAEFVLGGLKRFDVPEKNEKRLLNGISLPISEEFEGGFFTVYSRDGLIGLAERKEGKLVFAARLDG